MEPVQHVFINHDTNLLDVTLQDIPATKASTTTIHGTKQEQVAIAAHGNQTPSTETLHTTTEHPFITNEHGFVAAMKLIPGEKVLKLYGNLGIVVKFEIVLGQAVRYNLTVKDLHTYAVGVNQWVVHNTGICGMPGFANQVDSWRSQDPGNPRNLGGVVVRDVNGNKYPSGNHLGYDNIPDQGKALKMRRTLMKVALWGS